DQVHGETGTFEELLEVGRSLFVFAGVDERQPYFRRSCARSRGGRAGHREYARQGQQRRYEREQLPYGHGNASFANGLPAPEFRTPPDRATGSLATSKYDLTTLFLLRLSTHEEERDGDHHQHRPRDLEEDTELCVHGVKLRIN